MTSLSSLERQIDKLKAMILTPEGTSGEIDLSLFTEAEHEQIIAIQASLPPNGTIKDVTDEQLAQLQRLVLAYKSRV